MVIGPERGTGPRQRGFTVALVDNGLHYLLDMKGTEELYDLTQDPLELRNLKGQSNRETTLNRLRISVAEILRDNRAIGTVASAYLKQLLALLGSMIPRQSL
jgi:hypothetical protein